MARLRSPTVNLGFSVHGRGQTSSSRDAIVCGSTRGGVGCDKGACSHAYAPRSAPEICHVVQLQKASKAIATCYGQRTRQNAYNGFKATLDAQLLSVRIAAVL
jgi:hypothetical protein